MHIAKELLYNVSSSNLNRFLSEHDIKNEQKMRYADHRVMLEQFIKDGLITIGDLNDFFYRELLYGHHRLMRVYFMSAKSCLQLKHKEGWDELMRKFQITDWDYNQIIETIPQRAETIKLATIQEERVAGELVRIHLIFLYVEGYTKRSRKRVFLSSGDN